MWRSGQINERGRLGEATPAAATRDLPGIRHGHMATNDLVKTSDNEEIGGRTVPHDIPL